MDTRYLERIPHKTLRTDRRVQKGCTGLASPWESVSWGGGGRHPGRRNLHGKEVVRSSSTGSGRASG